MAIQLLGRGRAMELHKWANAFRLVLLVRSSAAAVKSLFNSTVLYNSATVIFGGLAGTVMLQYNLAH